MFGEMLYTQWKWARTELFLYVLAAFLIPTIMIRIGFSYIDAYSIRSVLNMGAYAGIFFCALAIACAFGLAWRPYINDASLKHVGPLSLPISWPRFVQMRFLAGVVLLLVPTVAVWIGGVIATASAPIPPTLHTYPGGIAIRFFFAALIAYAAGFLLQYAGGKHAVRIAIFLFLTVVGVELAGQLLGYDSIVGSTWNALTSWPGPFSIFGARWMLIDV
jgi:hypothetical protein